MTHRQITAAAIVAIAFTATATAQTIHTVGPGALPQIRDALAIAATGDRIVVQPGSYAQFVDTVGVTIVAATPGTVDIEFDPQFANCTTGPFCVLSEAVTRLLPPRGATSHLVGLNFSGASTNVGPVGAVLTTLFIGSGRAVLDDCTIASHNRTAVTVDSADAHFVRCAVMTMDTFQETQAIHATAASITAIDSQFLGPTAFLGISGTAVTLRSSSLHGSNLTLASGIGSPNPPAIFADAASTVWLSDSVLTGSSPTACTTDIAGTARLSRCTTTTPAGCPSVPTGFLLGAQQLAPMVSGQQFSVTYRTTPFGFVGVVFGYALEDRAVPQLEQPWFSPAGSATAGLYFGDSQGSATASWSIPAAFAGETVWLHSVGGVTFPLQTAPPLGGFVR